MHIHITHDEYYTWDDGIPTVRLDFFLRMGWSLASTMKSSYSDIVRHAIHQELTGTIGLSCFKMT